MWQYGKARQNGSEPDLLNSPDGMGLAPRYLLLMQHANTMGTP